MKQSTFFSKKSIKQLDNWARLNNKSILIHSGIYCGIIKDDYRVKNGVPK